MIPIKSNDKGSTTPVNWSSSKLLVKAFKIAEKAHAGQVRKTDGSPYIAHPVAVAELVKKHGFSDEVVAAALTHDVLEDTVVTEAELRTELGDEVVDIVVAVSEDKDLPWEERKAAYIEQVIKANENVKAVSVADKIHNAASVLEYYAEHGKATWSKFNRGREQKLWFERTLYDRLQAVWQHSLLDEYEVFVGKLENL